MIRQSFNAGWTAGPGLTAFASIVGAAGTDRPTVTLPYDVVRDLPRVCGHRRRAATGFFPGGFFEYTKTFDVPEEYRDKTVIARVRGRLPRRGGLHQRRVRGAAPERLHQLLRQGRPVPALRRAEHRSASRRARTEDSRWYTGAGIYRDTKIIVGDLVHVALDGVRITTPDIDAERAVVAVATTVENEARATRTVRVDHADPRRRTAQVVASGSAPVTLLPAHERARAAAAVRARPGAVERGRARPSTPRETTVTEGDDRARRGAHARSASGRCSSTRSTGCGSTARPSKLRGACIHHDNGLLGAAADRACRGAPRRAPQGGRLQRHPQRAQPDQPGHARRVRPARDARHGRDVRHVDRGEVAVRLLARLPRVVGARRRGDGREGLQPPERDHVLDRQRDLRGRARRSARAGAAGSPRRSARSTTPASSPTRINRLFAVADRVPRAARHARRGAGDRRQHADRRDRRRDAAGQRVRGGRRARRRSPPPCSTSPATTTASPATSSTASASPTASSSAPRRSRPTSTSCGGSCARTRT